MEGAVEPRYGSEGGREGSEGPREGFGRPEEGTRVPGKVSGGLWDAT